MTVTLLGFPTDVNSSYRRGPAKAPAAIRSALWSEAGNPFAENGIDVRAGLEDPGDVALREDDSDRATIEAAIEERLDAGERIVSMGGDHSITYPIVRAYGARFANLAIVHVDAHPDLYPVFQGNPYSHACPFARILEDGAARTLVQVGIRTMSDAQRPVAERYGVRGFGPWQMAQALAALPHGRTYVSIDLDGLDPAFAPGVSHREPGGLSVRDVIELIKAIPGEVVGGDVVELNPDEDVAGLTAGVAAKLVKELAARTLADLR